MVQSGRFLGRLLGPVIKTRLSLIKNVIKPLAKSDLIPPGLTAAASAADAGIHNRPSSAALVISNDEKEDIIKIAKSLEDSGLMLNWVTETVQNEVKEQKGGFLSMLLGTLGAGLLGTLLTGRGVKTTSQGQGINRPGKDRGINRAGEGVLKAGYGISFSKMVF